MDLCYDAETHLCDDLLRFSQVIEYKTKYQLVRLCEDFDAIACAVIDFENKQCTIYIDYRRKNKSTDLKHEVNHCHGWLHDNTDDYEDKPWYPIERLQ